jgi:hypothetical protein
MNEQDVTTKLGELSGLQRWTEEQARFVLEACEASGEPTRAFARRWGFYSQRIHWWKERFRRTEALAPVAMASTSTSTFLPVTVREDAAAPLVGLGGVVTGASAIAVKLSHDVRIEVTELDAASVAWVAELVKALREVSP